MRKIEQLAPSSFALPMARVMHMTAAMVRRTIERAASVVVLTLWASPAMAADAESPSWLDGMLGKEAFSAAKTVAIALLLFLVGWIIARVLAAAVLNLLRRTQVDDQIASKLGIEEKDTKAGRDGVERAVSGGVFWTVMLLVVVGVLQYAGLSQVATPLQNLLNVLGAAVPALLKAGLILGIAYLVGRVLAILVERVVGSVGLEKRLAAWTGDDAPENKAPIGKVAGRVVFSLALLLGLGGALDALEIATISGPIQGLISRMMAALPLLLIAVVFVVAGWVFGRIAKLAVANLLAAFGFDALIDRIKLRPAFGKQTPSQAVGWLVMAFILLNAGVAALDRLGMRTLADPITDALGQFWDLLPTLGVSAVIIAIGLVLARVARDLVTQVLAGVGVDKLLARFGLESVAARDDIVSRPSAVLGWVVYAAITLLALAQALANLGLMTWATYVDKLLTFSMTKLLIAMVLVAIGFGLGHRVRAFIASREFEGAKWVAELGRTAILVFATTMALNQLGVAEDFVLLAFGLLFGALCLALGLSFGLGGREVASEIVRKRYDGLSSGTRASTKPAAPPAAPAKAPPSPR